MWCAARESQALVGLFKIGVGRNLFGLIANSGHELDPGDIEGSMWVNSNSAPSYLCTGANGPAEFKYFLVEGSQLSAPLGDSLKT